MGKNIRFKPLLTKQAYDPEGRKMTMVGQDPSAKYQDELQIQVEDRDLKITMMWSVEAF